MDNCEDFHIKVLTLIHPNRIECWDSVLEELTNYSIIYYRQFIVKASCDLSERVVAGFRGSSTRSLGLFERKLHVLYGCIKLKVIYVIIRFERGNRYNCKLYTIFCIVLNCFTWMENCEDFHKKSSRNYPSM